MKKITFIIYASVIAITAIFALIFKQYVNVHIESLIPAYVFVGMLYAGYSAYRSKSFFRHGRWHTYTHTFDFKYSKDKKGEGEFEIVKPSTPPDKISLICTYSMIWGAAFLIPFIVFFKYEIKMYSSLVVILITALINIFVSLPLVIKETKQAKEAEKAKYEQWEKELEEQKKREELGKWK